MKLYERRNGIITQGLKIGTIQRVLGKPQPQTVQNIGESLAILSHSTYSWIAQYFSAEDQHEARWTQLFSQPDGRVVSIEGRSISVFANVFTF
jgi:hypothetical protein